MRLMTKYGKKKAALGTLYLTATHLIFVDPDCFKETWVCLYNYINEGVPRKKPEVTSDKLLDSLSKLPFIHL